MSKLALILVLLLLSITSEAQEDQKKAITAQINQFFVGMKEADSLKIKSTLADNCFLKSVTTNSKSGETEIREESMAHFIKAVTTNRDGLNYDEHILSYDIKIDEKMAIAWTPYRFYLNEVFLHCGVNVFSMVLLDGQWKIIGILDTRRKRTCEED